MTKLRVAVFLPSDHLGMWSWTDVAAGRLAASGTDGQILALAQRLSNRGDVTLLPLFCGSLPAEPPAGARAVGDLAEAAGAAADWNADVILFIERADDPTRAGIATCEQRGLRAVAWAHNGPYGKDRDLLARTATVRRVVCVSQPHADLLRHKAVFDKVAVINNSLLVPTANANDVERDGAAVCFLGATVFEKGFHHLVRAWPTVRAAEPSATLTIFGSALLYDRTRSTGPLGLGLADFESTYVAPVWGTDADRLAAEHGVRVAGLVKPAELSSALQQFAVAVVNPWASRNGSVETFCVSAIEAAAAGCAVIGGRRLGLTETVRNRKTGILIRDEDALAGAIVDLIVNPERAATLGQAGRDWAPQRFSTARADDAWMALLRDVAADRPARPPRLALSRLDLRTAVRQAIRFSRFPRRLVSGAGL